MDIIELLGWTATLILLIGYWANAHKKLYSWIVWLIGNTLMLIYAVYIGSYSVAFLSVVLMGMNIYGYFSWKWWQKNVWHTRNMVVVLRKLRDCSLTKFDVVKKPIKIKIWRGWKVAWKTNPISGERDALWWVCCVARF